VDVGPDKTLGTADDLIINMTPFVSGLNLRTLLPPITGNQASGLFPDPTMGGVVVQPDLNADINHDGIPDILK
jgi:hypothetical protein